MKKLNPSIVRVGDQVRIVNPQIFIRCGYPWSKQYVIENVITADERQGLAKLLGYNYATDIGGEYFRPYNTMLEAFAYFKLIKNNFGGRERSIHTENKPELQDKICRVVGKKTVKTGVYRSGSCYGEEGDWEPPYLDDEKTHIILELCEIDNFMQEFKIESKNVEKVLPESFLQKADNGNWE
jgi:hypothetical protein